MTQMSKLSFNVDKTKALIVGISEYIFLPKIDPVKQNTYDFANALINSSIIGLDESNIKIICNLRHDEIINAIDDFIRC